MPKVLQIYLPLVLPHIDFIPCALSLSLEPEVTIEPNVRTLLVPSGKRLVLNCSVSNHEDKEETITWVTHYNK